MSALAGARILILGINYAPETTGISPYTTEVATGLARLGGDVRVVTGVPHYPQWKRQTSSAFLWRTERRHGVQVIRAAHYVPGSQSAVKRAAFEASWFAMAAPHVLRQRVDAVLAVSPALAAAPLGRMVAARAHAPWAMVVQDLMGAAATHSGISGGRSVARAVNSIEAASMRAASLVGVIGEGFRDAVVRRGVPESRTRLLPNWTHIEPSTLGREQARRLLGWPLEEFIVVHTGNMGLKQGLDNVVDAAAASEDDETGPLFVLVGDGSQRAALQRRAAGLRRIRFEPPVDEDTYPHVLAAADVLLVNERPGMVEMSLPSKLTSYLAAGRPVLAAVPGGGWTAAQLRQSGAAVVVEPGQPEALLATARQLARSPSRCSALGEAGARYSALNWSAATGLARYESLVTELLAHRGN